MKKMCQGGAVILAIVLAVAFTTLVTTHQKVSAGTRDEPKSAGGAHYSVVMTEGHNLLVTDNGTNKIYFYTIDKDKPIGSPLKLRASVDLTKVGQDEIQITAHNLEGAGK
jgi:hypothetical protein